MVENSCIQYYMLKTKASELKSVIPPKAFFARSARFADSQHSFAGKLEKWRTTSFANALVPMTARNWNSLPASIFPSNLQNPGSQTPTPPPSYLINFPFSSLMQGSFEIHRDCIILVRPFLHSISLKKKNMRQTASEHSKFVRQKMDK